MFEKTPKVCGACEVVTEQMNPVTSRLHKAKQITHASNCVQCERTRATNACTVCMSTLPGTQRSLFNHVATDATPPAAFWLLTPGSRPASCSQHSQTLSTSCILISFLTFSSGKCPCQNKPDSS